ncbi:LlaJI family restriction endonuclease [Shewanella olleyana]|uniref:LlaJI family restriction endonuclease n=1 Tax=Shewanella olleyana TaxID=135626 RepID=UPI00200D9C85|nr:LlaJI family restriction endonuclease [Shewanella olleyana]MCL1066250.1 LlaJI family restriction endonuclease [Shewanella olleyana]
MIEIYHDRSHLNEVPSDIKAVLKTHKLLLDKDRRIQFCGMIVSDNQAHIFFPRNSTLATTASVKENASRLFVQAIYNFSLQSKAIKYADDDGAGFIGDSQLGLIISLLKDYQINGLYSHRLVESVFNSGKTNWSKTIAKSMAFPSKNGPLYFDTWGTKHSYSQDSEVTRIHAAIMKQLISRFGWLISGSLQVKELEQVPNPKSDKVPIQLSMLNKELQVTYSDRDIWLLTQLKRFISQQRGNKPVAEVMGLRSFHVMWEHMLCKVLKNTIEVNTLLPSPAYLMQNSDGTESIVDAKKNSQRTDIVLRRPYTDEYSVVDAKYYGASSIASVPAWADLVKQFFYVTALKTIIPDNSSVSNAFIFPGSESGPIRKVHMRDKSSGAVLDPEYPPITCYYVCPNDVMAHYVKNQKMEDLSELLFE